MDQELLARAGQLARLRNNGMVGTSLLVMMLIENVATWFLPTLALLFSLITANLTGILWACGMLAARAVLFLFIYRPGEGVANLIEWVFLFPHVRNRLVGLDHRTFGDFVGEMFSDYRSRLPVLPAPATSQYWMPTRSWIGLSQHQLLDWRARVGPDGVAAYDAWFDAMEADKVTCVVFDGSCAVTMTGLRRIHSLGRWRARPWARFHG